MNRTRMLPAALAATAALALAASRPARASDTDQFGFGARPISMGGAFTALATDWTGAYYNPGAPAASGALSAGIGMSYADYNMRFDSAAGTADRETERVEPLTGITLGISAPLSSDRSELLNRLTFTLGAFLPTRALVSASIETAPGSPQYYLYGLRRDKITFMPSMSVRILPFDDAGDGPVLSVGAGATILADLSGQFTFDLSATAARSVAADVTLPYDAAPNVGIYFWPVNWISMGVAYRGALSLKADFDVQIVVDGTNLFPLQLEAVTLYQPQQIQGGVAIDPVDWLTIAADVGWYNWAAYDDVFITIRPVVPQVDTGFKDIVIPRLGVELEPVKGWTARAGYYYQPTPVPSQTGATNLIDLDKHVFSLGFGWTWWTEGERIVRDAEGPRIETVERNPISIDAFVQWHHLIPDSVDKVPGSSPQTGDSYDASGEIWNFGIQITIRS